MPVDIQQHLQNANYPKSVLGRRLAWRLVAPFFHGSPRFLYGWRNLLLRSFGAKLGSGVRFYPSARVFHPWNLTVGDHVVIGPAANLYSLAEIRIEANVLISQGAHLCAGSHDHRQPNLPLILRPIVIESGVWLAAECFIGPGVTVRQGAVVGARAVVVRDVAAGRVVAGNPAREVGTSP